MKIIDKIMESLSLYDEEEIFDEDITADAVGKPKAGQSVREKLAERPTLFRKKTVAPSAPHCYEPKEQEAPKQRPSFSLRKPEEKKEQDKDKMGMRTINLPVTNKLINVIVLDPVGFEDVKKIADHLQGSQPVVVNFANTDSVVAKRMTDYISGTIYALGGSMKKMGRNILVCAPKNVDIDAGVEVSEERSVKKWER